MTAETELQFQNPDAPDYDWQKDREWFNQRLANARIHNSKLEQRIAGLREALSDLLGQIDSCDGTSQLDTARAQRVLNKRKESI